MFKKVFSNILGSEDKIDKELQDKISRMDLVQMRTFVNGKIDAYEVDEFGLHELIKKLMRVNDETSHHFIASDDMDSKKKKAFDLVILILKNKKVSVSILESTQEFLEVYDEMIKKYDYENKEIYESRIKKMIAQAANKINAEADIITAIEVTK